MQMDGVVVSRFVCRLQFVFLEPRYTYLIFPQYFGQVPSITFFDQELYRCYEMRLTATSTAAAALVGTVSAHTRVFSAWVNDVDQGDGRTTYIRSPPNNNPVKDLTSPDLACNAAGGTAMPDFVSAAAGDTVALEWYHDTRGDDIIASSHKGPVMTYIAPYFEDSGASATWTKIDEEGLEGTTWAVDNLIANKGRKDFTIPSNIKAGKYIGQYIDLSSLAWCPRNADKMS